MSLGKNNKNSIFFYSVLKFKLIFEYHLDNNLG